jgi:hypothetical protein
MSLTFPDATTKKPSAITGLPSTLKRPAFGTLYGFDASGGGGGASSGFNISTRDTESNILASTPSNPSGEVTIAFGTDTYELYVWDGSAWSIYSDDTGSSFQNRWAASFDGSDDYLTLTSAPSTAFDFGTGDFGLSMWVKADSISSSYHTVLGSYDNSANNWQVFVGSAGLNIWNGALKGGGTINAGTWYNCVVTRSSGVLKTYINGQENSSDTLTTSFTPSTSSSTVIGGFDGSSTWPRWNGLIDEVAIFGAGLSASNVTDIYNSGVPNDIPSLSLLGYWRMGDHSNDSPVAAGSITGITDSSGNGNDATQGTASAQPTFSDLTGETIYV